MLYEEEEAAIPAISPGASFIVVFLVFALACYFGGYAHGRVRAVTEFNAAPIAAKPNTAK